MNTEKVKSLNFINVTGLGNVGKSVVVDFLREFEGIHVPEHRQLGPFEFNLLRMPGGLLDLQHSLCEDWSPIRSDNAVKRFKRLVRTIGPDPRFFDVRGMIYSNGNRYQRFFNHQFIELSENYVNQFIGGQYHTLWPYEAIDENSWKRFGSRILSRMGFNHLHNHLVYLVDPKEFREKTNAYLNDLFRTCISSMDEAVVWCNAVEPYNPLRAHRLIDNLKTIVVNRDPRDIYVSGLGHGDVSQAEKSLWSNDNNGRSKKFLATSDLQTFVKRYALLAEKVNYSTAQDILYLRFEDVVHNYDAFREKVVSFLGLDHRRHQKVRSFFQPNCSLRNIGLWKKSPRRQEIAYIQENLGRYCYET